MIVVPVETEALSVDNILWHVEVWGCFQLSSGSQRISTVGQDDSGDYHGHHDTCRSGQQTSIHQGPWVTGLFLGIISKCKCVCEYVRVCVNLQDDRKCNTDHVQNKSKTSDRCSLPRPKWVGHAEQRRQSFWGAWVPRVRASPIRWSLITHLETADRRQFLMLPQSLSQWVVIIQLSWYRFFVGWHKLQINGMLFNGPPIRKSTFAIAKSPSSERC